MSLEVGQFLDNKYRIVRLIGEGGMGAVFEGENVRINRRVAIKVLHAAFTGNAEAMQRFEREAQAAGRIGNDHILEVLDLGILPNGDRYIIMEFLDGEPLSQRIRQRGRLMPHELAPLMRQVLVGLGAAHAVGIVHRDLKPDNLFILRQKAGNKDFIKIIDFGISKFQPLSGDGMKMTRTGAVMGTPYYMSPEQASGSGDADARSDVYSLGVIMYEAVTGRVPFDAGTFNQLMFKIVLADVPAPQSVVPDLDPAFASIVSKTMARDSSQRFQTTEEVVQALDEWLQSGRAVGIPSAAPSASAGHLPPAVTAGTWATSQPGASTPPAKKSNAPLVAALLGGGALLLGGGAFAAYALQQRASAATTASSAMLPSGAPSAAVPNRDEKPLTHEAASTSLPPTVSPVSVVPALPSVSAAVQGAGAPSATRAAARSGLVGVPVARSVKPAPAPVAPSPVKPGTPDFGY